MRTYHQAAAQNRLSGAVLAAGMVALGLLAAPSHAQSLSEGFESLATLQAAGSGWSFQNLSFEADGTWIQGNSAYPPGSAQAGTPGSYAEDDYQTTDGSDATGDTISDWMITPALTYVNGSTVTFYTRTATGATFPDRLEVRFSSNGSSVNVGATPTSVGDFTKTLLTVNPNLLPGNTNYPDTWTPYTITLSGLSGATSGRVAFRYFVTDGGAGGANSNSIGVDSLVIAAPAPEPSEYAAFGLGLLGLAGLALKARRRSVTA